jgi:hypothetical protein
MNPQPTTTITLTEILDLQDQLLAITNQIAHIHSTLHDWIRQLDIPTEEPTSWTNTTPGDVAARDTL